MSTELFEAGATDVLYLVDLSGYVFRAYHAIAPLSSPQGEPTQAVLGTVNMLERLLKQRRPHLLAVAMDSRTPTHRKQFFPAYKATRPPPPEDLKQQMTRVQQIIEAWRVPVLQCDGYEADDVIATFVHFALEQGLRTVIVSADKDLMQLVSDRVLLWDTMRDRVIGTDEVHERFGVETAQLRDLLALTGDPSDNVPGVPSIGPKTARDLLNQYGTLDGIYERLDSIPRKKLQQTLREHAELAKLSQKLVTLEQRVPVACTLEALTRTARDLPALRGLYQELGFQRHLSNLNLETEPEPPPGVELDDRPRPAPAPAHALAPETEPPLHTQLLTELEPLRGFAASARAAGRLALTVELVGDGLIGLGLCCGPGHAAYLPFAHRYLGVGPQLSLEECRSVIAPLLGESGVQKLTHDGKEVSTWLARRGFELDGIGFDSMLAGYLLDPGASHALTALAQRVLRVALTRDVELALPKVKSRKGQRLAFDELELDRACSVAALEAHSIFQLQAPLERELEEEGLLKLYTEVELPLCSLLAQLELTGVLVDTKVLAGLGTELETQIARLEKQAHQLAGKEFNVNSPRQLETLLFDELGLKSFKRTKTSRSTDAATLESLADEHELPRVILELRQLAKLKGTYVDALPKLVSPLTRRIHTRWGQAVAATGRISSSDPNLQNIPIRTELGRAIREAFIAPPGMLLVSADYSQIELRVLAHLSGDRVLTDAFRQGQDVHTRTAIEIFEVSADDVTPELRRRAKAVNFGVVYGQGDSGLARSLGISRTEAATFIATYFRRHQGVREFMDATLNKARAGDSVRTLFGRRRLVADMNSTNRALRLAAERIAMNTPIQGTAADLLKMAMLEFADPPVPGARMILTVHDELVFEVPEADAPVAAVRIRETMEQVYPLDVPLVVDVGWGPNWNQAH